ARAARGRKAGNGWVECSIAAGYQQYVLGFTRSATNLLLVTDIEFGIELFADGTFAVVESGVDRTGPLGPYADGDRFAIAVTGAVLRYERNGVPFYTSLVPPTYPLRVDAALQTPGATIGDVVLAGKLVRLGGTIGDADNDGRSE